MNLLELYALGDTAPGAVEGVEWSLDGVCRGVDPAIFFPLSARADARDEAYAHCGRCPVTWECAEFSLRERMEYGVFGGLNESDRATLEKRRRSPGKCETCGRPTGPRPRSGVLRICHNCTRSSSNG